MKRVLRQAIVAVAITVIALELALQLASLFAEPLFARTSVIPGSPDAITILCVGDSHTYGAPLPEEESYPSQLQELLERRYPSREFRVVNLGLPGVNTGFVVNRLKRQILELRPQLVMVSAGRNNIWNLLHTDSEPSEDTTWTSLRRVLLHVKLFRLAAVLSTDVDFEPTESGHGRWQSSDQEELKREIRNEFMRAKPFFGKNADTRVPLDRARMIIQQDMERVVEMTRSFGIPVIWYNYPQRDGRRRTASEAIDAAGARLEIPIVRSEEDVVRALADGRTDKELRDAARAVSPLHHVDQPTIPFLLIHGDADELVPLSQSEKLAAAIKKAGGSAALIVKRGGGHPWLTLPVEVAVMADWFDKQLRQ
jgi:lysophospholipase L1-like esterase